jgi:hypothetical protein
MNLYISSILSTDGISKVKDINFEQFFEYYNLKMFPFNINVAEMTYMLSTLIFSHFMFLE